MKLFPLILVFIFLPANSIAASQVDEHVNARILGQLVYNDMTLTVEDENSKDVIEGFKEENDVLLNIYWQSDEGKGLDPTKKITFQLKNQPSLTVLERIVEQLDEDGNAAWQLRHGTLEIGLKEHLASVGRQRLETYYIRDLLFVVRDSNAPNLGTFDDDRGGSSGGGNSGGGNSGGGNSEGSQQEEIDELIDLIVKFIEPNLWEQNGGPCSITNYKKTLLIRAPDFIHRQINGYSFLPRKPEDVRRRRVLYNNDGTRVIVDRLPLR